GGRHVDPVPVMTVSDANGNLVWQADPRSQQVVSPDVAAAADGILQATARYRTGTAANIGRPQIGKTGTDDNHDNAWFIGSVPQLTAAIWVGFHQGQIPMEPPRTRITVFGGTFPAQIWRVLMLRATAGMPAESFPTPEVRYLSVAVDVTQHPYCLPNEYTLPMDVEVLHFIAGTEPDQVCMTPNAHQKVIVPSVVGFAQAEGLATLEESGFYVQGRTEASTHPPGTIIYLVQAGGAGRPAAEVAHAVRASTDLHAIDAFERLRGSEQDRARRPIRTGHHVHAMVHAVGEVDVQMSRRPEHDADTRRATPVGVTRRVVLIVGLRLDDPRTEDSAVRG